MNFKAHFSKISEFLAEYKMIWWEETLNFYPHSLEAFPNEWMESLKHLSQAELWDLDSNGETSKLTNSSLIKFIEDIKALSILDKTTESDTNTLPEWAYRKVSEKKRHEITQITSCIHDLSKEMDLVNTIDIGGGVGHLSRILSHYYGMNTTSIDMNQDFQEKGKARLSKFPTPPNAGEMKFVNLEFGRSKSALKPIFKNDSFSIGLHTCGPLAVKHIDAVTDFKTKGLLNFGCCYAKMNPDQDVNISDYAKANGLPHSNHSLTLATRGYTKMTFEEYQLKERVKKMRYTLHLLYYKKLGIREFMSAGEIRPKDYWKPFPEYALERLENNKIEHDFSTEELQTFFDNKEIQEEVWTLYLANLIRWQLGRVIEHYILTDRALKLEEKGYQVTLKEFFNPKISPRNIGILATL